MTAKCQRLQTPSVTLAGKAPFAWWNRTVRTLQRCCRRRRSCTAASCQDQGRLRPRTGFVPSPFSRRAEERKDQERCCRDERGSPFTVASTLPDCIIQLQPASQYVTPFPLFSARSFTPLGFPQKMIKLEP